jgi:hypothetical protein
MADVQRAAEIAAHKTSYMLLDHEERMDTAWHGVVEYLYACGCGIGMCNRPAGVTFYDLLFAGMRAVSNAADDLARHHGRKGVDGDHYTPRFTQYWLPPRKDKYRDADGFSEHLCERLALRDVLGLLTGGQYEALVTLAAYDNAGVEAAEALGSNYKTFMNQVLNARKRIKEAWFEDETPPAPKKAGETCTSGHSRAEHGKQRSTGKWACMKCDRIARTRKYHATKGGRPVAVPEDNSTAA